MASARFCKSVSEIQRHESADQVRPLSGEGELEQNAHHAVVVILDSHLRVGMAGQLGVLDHRGAFEEQLLGGGVLQAFSQAAGAEDGAQLVELHLFADVEQEKSRRRSRAGSGLAGDSTGEPVYREKGVSGF